MNPVYEKLFDTYCLSILDEAAGFNDADINALLDPLPLEAVAKTRLNDALYGYFLQWSADAFAVGLHLGLSLVQDDIRRLRAQQVQQRAR